MPAGVKAATRLGYTRDPKVAKLMTYLRGARLQHKTRVMGLVTMFPVKKCELQNVTYYVTLPMKIRRFPGPKITK